MTGTDNGWTYTYTDVTGDEMEIAPYPEGNSDPGVYLGIGDSAIIVPLAEIRGFVIQIMAKGEQAAHRAGTDCLSNQCGPCSFIRSAREEQQ